MVAPDVKTPMLDHFHNPYEDSAWWIQLNRLAQTHRRQQAECRKRRAPGFQMGDIIPWCGNNKLTW